MKTGRASLERLLEERIVLLDGAMGTMIQALHLSERDYRGERFAHHPVDQRGNHDILAITRPSVIREIHDAYLAAGADVLKTCTFGANAVAQEKWGLAPYAYELDVAAARIAREAADRAATDERPRFVAGVLGPTPHGASISTSTDDPIAREVTFDALSTAYEEAARGLLDGGADALLIETVFDVLNAKAAVWGIHQAFDRTGRVLPILVSATLEGESGRLLSGASIEAFATAIAHARPLAVGLNCGRGISELGRHLETLAANVDARIDLHPNAGAPDADGAYPDGPERMADAMRALAERGLIDLAGGCCGTTPAHVQAMAAALRRISPRGRRPRASRCIVAGTDALTIGGGPIALVGERTSVTGSARFRERIATEDIAGALATARAQIDAGAKMLDVNMDDPMLDAQRSMSAFLRALGSDALGSRIPIVIDSSSWKVVEAGLRCVQGKPIVNGISLADGERAFVQRARSAWRLGAAIVISAADEAGPATTAERKIATCRRALELLERATEFPRHDVILDPLVFPVGTGLADSATAALAFIDAVRELKQAWAPVLACGGVSNVSFAFRGRSEVRAALNAVFLHHAAAAGLDLAIVDPESLKAYGDLPLELRARAEDLIFARQTDAADLLAAAEKLGGHVPRPPPAHPVWRAWPVERRIEHAIVEGLDEHVESDVLEAARALGGPFAIIEGPLARAMESVGDLFAQGKKLLPDVVRSARAMKKALAALEGSFPSASVFGAHRPKIVLATVRGDIHDIGKNLVGSVLGSQGFTVVDLGVRVAADAIAARARDEQADLVGVSGLITPSLDEMTAVARALDGAGLAVPLLVGGAATSPLHTAVKIAPSYRGPTAWGKDAPRAASLARGLIGGGASELVEKIRAEQRELRAQHARRMERGALASLEEARARPIPIDWSAYAAERPRRPTPLVVEQPLSELVPLVDWVPFLRAWGFRRRAGAEAERLLDDARRLLARLVDEDWLEARGVVGIYPANALGDDVVLYADDARCESIATFRFLRQQERKPRRTAYACLADFVAPFGASDWMGVFAATTGLGAAERVASFERAGDDYSALLLRSLSDRLAEAFSERLHWLVRTTLWGYAPNEPCDASALLRGDFRGIRPAFGFPALPDHAEKATAWRLLDVERRAGMTLTETFAMIPASSVSGIYLAHPRARYFAVGRIGRDQVRDYARRKCITEAAAEHWLAPNLGYRPETLEQRVT